MDSGDRLKAIFFIWGAFAAAAIASFGSGSPLVPESIFIALFYVIGVLVATRFVTYAPQAREEAEKAKRRSVDRLLASLSDDELDALRERLSSGDGELVSLEDVLRSGKERAG